MATGYIVEGSDGLPAIMIGPWAKDKLFYVKRICNIFNSGMKNSWHTRVYIDLLTGPGSCIVRGTGEEIPGSALLALQCAVPFTHYFFNDLKPELVAALESRSANCSYATVRCFNRDCNAAVDEMLPDLPEGSLDLCFIDLLKWEMRFESIKKLTQGRNMDLLITFHVGSIRRTIDRSIGSLDEFFPTPDWQEKYKEDMGRGTKPERALLNLYEAGLSEIGYKYVSDHILERNSRNARMYYLVFASRHPRGADFWYKVTNRAESGQSRMRI